MFKILSECQGGGYRYCRTEPPHPKRNSNNLYPLHRVLMENKLGRLLEKGEIVHHKDGDKRNNIIDNLEVLSNVEHAKLHAKRVSRITIKCPICGRLFKMRLKLAKIRFKQSKQKKLFCSHSCGTIYQFREKT